MNSKFKGSGPLASIPGFLKQFDCENNYPPEISSKNLWPDLLYEITYFGLLEHCIEMPFNTANPCGQGVVDVSLTL